MDDPPDPAGTRSRWCAAGRKGSEQPGKRGRGSKGLCRRVWRRTVHEVRLVPHARIGVHASSVYFTLVCDGSRTVVAAVRLQCI
eukprot:scaffold121012_cov63-Phaeocystis_antarctica.AAC.2